MKRSFDSQGGLNPQVENHCGPKIIDRTFFIFQFVLLGSNNELEDGS